MRVFPSTDLQRKLGEVLREADAAPVLLTAHDMPRRVIMPVAEFVRLKAAAGEALPRFGEKRAVVHRRASDPLGYDTRDLAACAARMADAAVSGRNKAAVRAEVERVRSRLGRSVASR